jgi:hypothetical protein
MWLRNTLQQVAAKFATIQRLPEGLLNQDVELIALWTVQLANAAGRATTALPALPYLLHL